MNLLFLFSSYFLDGHRHRIDKSQGLLGQESVRAAAVVVAAAAVVVVVVVRRILADPPMPDVPGGWSSSARVPFCKIYF